MNQNTYKYLSIVLAIVAAVFAYLYFTKPSAKPAEVIQDVAAQLRDCSQQIADWNKQYRSEPASEEKQSALQNVMQVCQDAISSSRSQL